MLAGVKINIFNAANDIKIESIRLNESIIHNSIYKRGKISGQTTSLDAKKSPSFSVEPFYRLSQCLTASLKF